MATATNEITGDSLTTKQSTDAYRDGWDRIFGNKQKSKQVYDLCTDQALIDELELGEE